MSNNRSECQTPHRQFSHLSIQATSLLPPTCPHQKFLPSVADTMRHQCSLIRPCTTWECTTWESLFTRLVQLLIVGSSCPTNQSTFVFGLCPLQQTALAREGISELDADSFKGCHMHLQLIPHRPALTEPWPRPFIREPSPHAYYTIGGLR